MTKGWLLRAIKFMFYQCHFSYLVKTYKAITKENQEQIEETIKNEIKKNKRANYQN